MSQTEHTHRTQDGTTTVEVRCTGHVRAAVGESSFSYTFEGDELGDFLETFLSEYDVAELLIATEEGSDRAAGWAPSPDTLPGTWRKNPRDEQIRRYARVLVNGEFNEHLEGFRTTLADDDRVALMYPFVYCV